MAIEEFDRIFDILSNKTAQMELLHLYSCSQHEFSHNGKISQEIGRSREDDIKALLQLYLGDSFNCNILNNNDNGADCTFINEISIKHIGNKIGGASTIKTKWTSDEKKARDYIKQMLLLDPKNYTHLLLIYIDLKKNKTIQIVAISAATIMDAVDALKESAFKTAFGTNTRGVEYSKEMMKLLIEKKYFQIDIKDAILTGGLDPIKRRQSLIKLFRSTFI